MPIQPRTEDEIYDTLQSELSSRTDKMTNFVEGSFNDQFIRSYAAQIRELEVKTLAAELTGYIDFAGRDITNEDLSIIGVENVEPEEINQYTNSAHLDALAANQGVTRDSGTRATGKVTFEVSDDTVAIPQGYTVGTDPESAIGGLEFLADPTGTGTTEFDNTVTVTPDTGTTSVTVDVVAAEPGSEYNLGTGTVTYLPNPKPGIQSVTNTVPMVDGEDEQSNASLRSDAKNALFESSEGGTRSGIISQLQSVSESDVRSVALDEFTDVQPPYVDVVVDGGDRSELTSLIEEAKPYGLQYNLVRPSVQSTGIHTNLLGTDVETTLVRESIVSHFNEFTINDPFYRTELINEISFSDSRINSVPVLNTYHNSIDSENNIYDSAQSIYELQYGPFGRVRDEQHYVTDSNTYTPVFSDIDASSVNVEVITDDVREPVSDSDITVTDSTGDGSNDTIELADSIVTDTGTVVTIDYDHDQWTFDSVADPDGTEYTRGTDYQLIDNDGDGLNDSIEWLGATTPTDGNRFTVSYHPYRSFTGDLVVGERARMDVDSNRIDIRTIE